MSDQTSVPRIDASNTIDPFTSPCTLQHTRRWRSQIFSPMMYIRQPGSTELAEADIRQPPAETDESLPADIFSGVEAGQLRAGFDHEDAGQKRSAGDVSGHPEFIVANVLVADDFALGGLSINDGVQVLHVAALRIAFADRRLIEDDAIEINLRDVVEDLRGHEQSANSRRNDHSEAWSVKALMANSTR